MDLLTEKQVLQRTSLSRSTLWRLRYAGDFPPPMKISERRVAYRAEDVDAWIKARSPSQENA